MPERAPTYAPTVVAGTPIMSGDPNTGQQLFTQGGIRTASRLSGTAGGTACIWTGAGRLDAIHLHPGAGVTMPVASGIPITFFDSAVAASGLGASGYTQLAKVHPGLFANAPSSPAFNSGLLFYGGVLPVGHTFKSGLSIDSTSGQVGFTVSFTPVWSGSLQTP